MRLLFCGLLVASGVAAAGGGVSVAAAEAPAQFCGRIGDDDTLRPLPAGLGDWAGRALNIQAPASQVAATTVFRCAARRVLVCTTGANLDCDKADLRRDLPAANAYCRANPGSTVIPAVVTGHATPFNWSCRGTRAVPGSPAEPLDAHGFKINLWVPLR